MARGWGYLYFSGLNLYYAHGRWYNPVIALWLSPNEKGDYLYGGDRPADDAVNWYVGQFWANARWGYQQFQRASQATVELLIAAGKSSPEAKALVLEAGQFVADTAMASHYAMLPPPNWTLWDRVGNATRATVPVVTAEGMVAGGPMALGEAGQLVRSLLAGITIGIGTGCAVAPQPCQRAQQVTVDFLENQPNRVEHIMQARHAWDRLVPLTGNLIEDYRAVQPFIRQVVSTGTRTVEAMYVEFQGLINGQEVVVRGRELNGVFTITDAWVRTLQR